MIVVADSSPLVALTNIGYPECLNWPPTKDCSTCRMPFRA
jgi:hypothetical protein